AVPDNRLPSLSQLTVTTALGRQVEDDGTWRHTLHHILSHQNRGFLTGNNRCRDDHVAFVNNSSQQFTLTLIKRFVLGCPIATRVWSAFRLDRQLYEASSEALALLLCGWFEIVSGCYATEPTGSRNGLKSGSPSPDHKNTGGSNRTRRGGE